MDERLQVYKDLLDQGILTEEEYQAKVQAVETEIKEPIELTCEEAVPETNDDKGTEIDVAADTNSDTNTSATAVIAKDNVIDKVKNTKKSILIGAGIGVLLLVLIVISTGFTNSGLVYNEKTDEFKSPDKIIKILVRE